MENKQKESERKLKQIKAYWNGTGFELDKLQLFKRKEC